MGRGAFLSAFRTRPRPASIGWTTCSFRSSGCRFDRNKTHAFKKLGPPDPTAWLSQARETACTCPYFLTFELPWANGFQDGYWSPDSNTRDADQSSRPCSISTPTDFANRTAPGFSTRTITFLIPFCSRHNFARSLASASTVKRAAVSA